MLSVPHARAVVSSVSALAGPAASVPTFSFSFIAGTKIFEIELSKFKQPTPRLMDPHDRRILEAESVQTVLASLRRAVCCRALAVAVLLLFFYAATATVLFPLFRTCSCSVADAFVVAGTEAGERRDDSMMSQLRLCFVGWTTRTWAHALRRMGLTCKSPPFATLMTTSLHVERTSLAAKKKTRTKGTTCLSRKVLRDFALPCLSPPSDPTTFTGLVACGSGAGQNEEYRGRRYGEGHIRGSTSTPRPGYRLRPVSPVEAVVGQERVELLPFLEL